MRLVELAAVWARPPPPLYLRGELPSGSGVAIVGTRRPTVAALAFAEQLGSMCAELGWPVWSGGARGIDGAAHRGALAAGGITVAVLTGCFDDPYPKEHLDLFDRIVANGGALVSLQPPGARREQSHFLQRNLVMAALARATVVVEARLARSGAMSMARSTRRVGHPLFVVPQAPWSKSGGGCARLIDGGATPLLSARDAVDKVQLFFAGSGSLWAPPAACDGDDDHAVTTEPPPLDDDARAVLAALDRCERHVDELCESTGLAAHQVGRALMTLSLRGASFQTSSGRFCLAP